MIFDIKQFEQHFDEKTLRKGLKLFEKKSFLSHKSASSFEFNFIDEGFRLIIKKRGYKVISHTCTCGKKKLCEHLSACLFYWQQEDLGISKQLDLENRILSPARVNTIDTIGHRLFRQNSIKIKAVLQPFLHAGALSQEKIDSLYKVLTKIILETEADKINRHNNYYIDLAVSTELPTIFSVRIEGDDEKIKTLFQRSINNLSDSYSAGLDSYQMEAWFGATLSSLRNNKIVNTEVFYFLVPRLVLLLNNKIQIQRLKTLLLKRHYKVKYPSRINKLQVVKLQLLIQEVRLFKIPLVLKREEKGIEFIFAQCELDVCNGHTKKALRRLDLNYEVVKRKSPEFYSDYLHYLLAVVRKAENKKSEVKYLKEHLVYNPYINDNDLRLFFSHLSEKEKIKEIGSLLTIFRIKNLEINFDKISKLLLYSRNYDQLLLELSGQKNKFHLLHEIALVKWPHFDNSLIASYSKHLGEAFASLKYFNLQKQVFDKAKIYLESLPDEKRKQILDDILSKLSPTSILFNYINKAF